MTDHACELCPAGVGPGHDACLTCWRWACSVHLDPGATDPTCVECAGEAQPSPPAERQVVDVDPGGRL